MAERDPVHSTLLLLRMKMSADFDTFSAVIGNHPVRSHQYRVQREELIRDIFCLMSVELFNAIEPHLRSVGNSVLRQLYGCISISNGYPADRLIAEFAEYPDRVNFIVRGHHLHGPGFRLVSDPLYADDPNVQDSQTIDEALAALQRYREGKSHG